MARFGQLASWIDLDGKATDTFACRALKVKCLLKSTGNLREAIGDTLLQLILCDDGEASGCSRLTPAGAVIRSTGKQGDLISRLQFKTFQPPVDRGGTHLAGLVLKRAGQAGDTIGPMVQVHHLCLLARLPGTRKGNLDTVDS